MSRNVPDKLRGQVGFRAGFRCEYCRLHESFAMYKFEVDHIVAIKHGGLTELDNLAYCCVRCNRNKGTDLVTVLDGSKTFVPLFNPRVHIWEEHFETHLGVISGKTDIGEATVKLLNFNTVERIIGRRLMEEAGVYP